MKKLLILPIALISFVSQAQTYVDGYTKRDGTYVQGHYRSKANNSIYDNYSTKDNMNPYTGKRGSRQPNSYQSKKPYSYGSYKGYTKSRNR